MDPFVQLEFAGSKIESSTQYGTFDPVWGQKLVVHGQFPSMAEKFVIRVKDRFVIFWKTFLLAVFRVSNHNRSPPRSKFTSIKGGLTVPLPVCLSVLVYRMLIIIKQGKLIC